MTPESTVLTRAEYSKGRVAWSSSGVPSTERLRLTFEPASVRAGGEVLPKRDLGTSQPYGWWTHDATTGLTVVHHVSEADVVVT